MNKVMMDKCCFHILDTDISKARLYLSELEKECYRKDERIDDRFSFMVQ